MNKWKKNDKGNLEVSFPAVLLSVSDNVLENNNGTAYRIADIEFEDASGNTQVISATMYEANAEQLPSDYIGQRFLATAEKRPGQTTFVRVSHLQSAGRASDDMFGFSEEAFEASNEEVTQESEHASGK